MSTDFKEKEARKIAILIRIIQIYGSKEGSGGESGEALYADIRHLGRQPIRLAWFSVVLPGLLLNYFWPAGREVISKQVTEYVRPLKSYRENIDMRKVKRVPGTAVYMAESPVLTPPAFVHLYAGLFR